MNSRFNTVEECLDSLRRGEIVLVTDDADRENEGDCICAAEFASLENVNFMATHAKGLICMPMSSAMCRKLDLPQQACWARADRYKEDRLPLWQQA